MLDVFRLIYMGRFAPLHSGLGFRLIGNGSLLLLLVHLCLGDNHTISHLASLPQIHPVAHFAQGVTLPPIKGVGYQSKIRRVMSAIPLQVSCYRTKRRVTRRTVALPPWRCCLTTLLASSQPPPSPWPGLPTGFQTKIRLIMPQFVCRSPATVRRGGRRGELSPCLLGAVA